LTASLASYGGKIAVVEPTPAPEFDLLTAYRAGILGSEKEPTVTGTRVESIVGCHTLVGNG